MMAIGMAVILATTLACGGSAASESGASATRGGLNAGAKASGGTGFPECDKYMRLVSDCIKTKMPEWERAGEQQRLEHFRDLLSNSMIGGALAQSCEENIRLEVQRDRYGCYAAEAAKAGIQNPCSLVTRAELQEIVKAPLQDGQQRGSKCVYGAAGTPPRSVTIEVHWTNGGEELDAARAGVGIANKRARTSTGDPAVAGETVDGLGDDAFLTLAGLMPMLYVRKEDASVSVEAFGATREQMIDIARKAMARLR